MSFFKDLRILFSSDTSPEEKGQAKLNLLKTGGSLLGLDLAREAADHYQMAKGKDLILSKQKLEEYGIVRRAEEKNQQRLMNSLNIPGKLYRKSDSKPVRPSELQDHERAFIEDYYDVDLTPDNYKYDYLNPDLAHALGSFKLKSTGNLEFVKFGNKLLPYGEIEHSIQDIYNFNKGTPNYNLFDPLEKSGRATPFTIKSTWKKRPVGVIVIDGNKADTSGIEWH